MSTHHLILADAYHPMNLPAAPLGATVTAFLAFALMVGLVYGGHHLLSVLHRLAVDVRRVPVFSEPDPAHGDEHAAPTSHRLGSSVDSLTN